MAPRRPVSVSISISMPTPTRMPTTGRISLTPARAADRSGTRRPVTVPSRLPIRKVSGRRGSGNHCGKLFGPTMRTITTPSGSVEQQAAGAADGVPGEPRPALRPRRRASLARSIVAPRQPERGQDGGDDRQHGQHEAEADVRHVDAAADDHHRHVHRRRDHAVDRRARDDGARRRARQPHPHQHGRDDGAGAEDRRGARPGDHPGEHDDHRQRHEQERRRPAEQRDDGPASAPSAARSPRSPS